MGGRQAFCAVVAGVLLGCGGSRVPAALPDPSGLSWREQGFLALRSGDREEAVRQFERWVQADPRDSGAWYALAGLHARAGHREKALLAFESAVDAGWSDAQFILRDGDLEAIRSDRRFQWALQRSMASRKEDPEGYRRRIVRMSSLGTYIAMLPPDYESGLRSYPLCVILHGRGSNEVWHGKMADALGRDGVIYLAPRSPYPKEGGWSAWPEDERIVGVHDAYALYAEWVLACVEDARKLYRVSGERIYLLGHSQGAFAAHAIACMYPEKIASYFAYGGALPAEFREELNGLKTNRVKVVLAHGTEDRIVPQEKARQTSDWLSEAGVPSTLKTFKTDHTFIPDVAAAIREWLDADVRGRRASEPQ